MKDKKISINGWNWTKEASELIKGTGAKITLFEERFREDCEPDAIYLYQEDDVKLAINLVLNQIESGDYSDIRSKFEQHIGKELLE